MRMFVGMPFLHVCRFVFVTLRQRSKSNECSLFSHLYIENARITLFKTRQISRVLSPEDPNVPVPALFETGKSLRTLRVVPSC